MFNGQSKVAAAWRKVHDPKISMARIAKLSMLAP
jgi:hypothetical protein